MHASNCQARHSRSSTAGTGVNAFSMAAVTSALISAGGKCVCVSDPLRDKVSLEEYVILCPTAVVPSWAATRGDQSLA